jgi:hypothetical protein
MRLPRARTLQRYVSSARIGPRRLTTTNQWMGRTIDARAEPETELESTNARGTQARTKGLTAEAKP